MVEFPLVNGLLAYLLRALPMLDLVVVSRLASVFASLGSLIFLALITKRVYGEKVALVTGLVFGLLPYSIFYSRTILPEPFFIMLALASLYTYARHLDSHSWRWLILSSAFFSLALLVKPMAVFFVPVFIGLRLCRDKRIKVNDIATGLIYLLAFVPLYLWRRWILQYPIGIPISDWLYNGVGKGTNLSPVYKIRFKPAWFRWIFYERLTKLFLGFVGLIPFGLGFLGGQLIFFLSWAIGALAYVIIFAAGNVQHDYYQIPLVPFVALAMGLGSVYLYKKFGIAVVSLILGLALFFSWKQVAGYYQINNWDIVLAGKAADKLLPSDAKVIAPYNGDTAFLFQTNRTGWPLGFEIDKKINEGAQYYVSVNYDDETNALMKKYKVIEQRKEYVIIKLI